MKTRKLTTMALLTAVALIIFVIEAQIPPVVPITGVKLGLSNIITVFAVWMLGAKEAAAILFVRIFLGAVFAGNFSTVFYSLGGGALALLTTVGLRRVLSREQLWIAGCLGAIAHSVGQMVVAVWISETVTLLVYLPIMIVCSIFTGSFTGLCAQILVGRDKLWKTIFK